MVDWRVARLPAYLWPAIGLLVLSGQAWAEDIISIGPVTGASVKWLDPSRLNENIPPSFDQWGMPITVPAGNSILSTASFYVSPSAGPQAATYFELQIYNWSGSNTTGAPIYESGQVLFSLANDNPPEPPFGLKPTIFHINAPVIAGNEYFFQITGDGVAAVAYVDPTSIAQIYFNKNFTGWAVWSGGRGFRADFTFSASPPANLDLAGLDQIVGSLSGAGTVTDQQCF